MFEALRWRLTAWYVLAFAVVFAVIGAVVFVWAGRRLSGEVDAAVRDVSDSARRAVVERGDIGQSEDDVRDIVVNANLSGSADVFVLLVSADGSIVGNPGDVPTQGFPVEDGLSAAGQRGEDWRSYTFDGQPVQIRTLAVRDSSGTLLGFVQAGKSLEERNESLRTLVIVLGGGGMAGLIFAMAGGLFVAGIAIKPIRRSFDRQREFVADASHELRTPLAVIRANSETLAATQPDDEAIEDIVAETSYMTRLLDDLLLLAGSDVQRLDVRASRVDVAAIVRDAGQAGRTLAAAARLSFDARADGELPVAGDEERLREVLLVLIDNAVKYTPPGGKVSLVAARKGAEAVIEVRDTGIGIDREHIDRVFDRFYRVDTARSRSAGGAGLGLSIAREIIRAHGGSIDLQSQAGGGTTAVVLLPLSRT